MEKFSSINDDKTKWLAVEIIAELCSLCQQNKIDLFNQITANGDYAKYCLDYLFTQSVQGKQIGSEEDQTPTNFNTRSLCTVEDIFLPRYSSEEGTDQKFISLANQSYILREIASGIAEMKHTFIMVTYFLLTSFLCIF